MNFKSIIILSLLLSSSGCELRAKRTAPELSGQTLTVSVLKPIEAVVSGVTDPLVTTKETKIASQADIDGRVQKAQFVSGQKGWAITSKSLFTTSDGSTSWRQLPFRPPVDSRIMSLFFADELRGWLVVTKQIYTERYGLGNSSQLLATKDGGTTWHEQANLKQEVRIADIHFFDANHGLAVGSKTIDQPREQGPPYEEIAAWKTVNGGDVWTEISEVLKGTLRGETASANDSGWNVRWLSSNQILLLTKYGQILKTSDQGASWQTLARFKDERPNGVVSSTGYYKLVLNTEKNINIIAGALGNEGYWGNLVSAEDKSWVSYELTLLPIFDATFLSKDEVLACGMDMKSANEKQKATTVGVILYSQDHGKSWTPIYRSNVQENFISLSRVEGNTFYAVSDIGRVVAFSFPPAGAD
jgi:photosystem II stability/assembly factor-like uncharacterized protein